jgi:hypothetical protein
MVNLPPETAEVVPMLQGPSPDMGPDATNWWYGACRRIFHQKFWRNLLAQGAPLPNTQGGYVTVLH